jgi:hypothetical protein
VNRTSRLLDGLTAASAGAAAGLLLVGPWRGVVGGAPVSVRWTHALFVAISLAAVRHALRPAPSLWSTCRDWRRAIERRPDLADSLVAFCLTRPAVLLVGFAAVTFGVLPSSDQPPAPRHALRDLPARFDANWYAGIALEGYRWQSSFDRQQNVAFFPAYPMLMRAVGALSGGIDERLPRGQKITRLTWAGLAVSLVAFVGAGWYFARLARETVGIDRARPAVILLAAYPFAVFFSAAYTESLFLLGTLACWYHLRRGEHARAAAWGLLVGLTRPNGFLLGVPLGLIALGLRDAPRIGPSPSVTVATAPSGETRSGARLIQSGGWGPPNVSRLGISPAGLAVAAMPGAALLLHTAWLYQQTGVWFAWAKVQIAWGRTVTAAAPEGLGEAVLAGGLLQLVSDHPYKALNALGLAFAFALVGPVWRRLGPAWTAYVLVNILPPLFAGGLLSMGRLTSTLFPLFLALASMVPPRAVAAVAAGFGLLQGLIAALFYTWREIY